ncbi:MAG: hypothetical protein JXL80_04865 [Planctomycetes bacterium]|nr:hypothetical protein [Planctomycetota bacterium]
MKILWAVAVSAGLVLPVCVSGCGVSDQDVRAFFKKHEGKTRDQVETELGESDNGFFCSRTMPLGMTEEQWRASEENIISSGVIYGDYVLYFNWFGMVIGAGRVDNRNVVVVWRDGF